MRNRLQLMPLDGERALDAAYKSATHLMDAGTAEAIVRFVAAAKRVDVRINAVPLPQEDSAPLSALAIEPALLSLVCRGLNERRKREGKPGIDGDLLASTGPKVIDEHYDDCMDGQPENVHRFVENELVTESGFRKPCAQDDARREPYGIELDALQVLVDRRLLRIEPSLGVTRVELIHDLLAPTVVVRRDARRKADEARRLHDDLRRQQEATEQAAAAEAERVQARHKLHRVIHWTVGAAAVAVVLGASTWYAAVQGVSGRKECQGRALARAGRRGVGEARSGPGPRAGARGRGGEAGADASGRVGPAAGPAEVATEVRRGGCRGGIVRRRPLAGRAQGRRAQRRLEPRRQAGPEHGVRSHGAAVGCANRRAADAAGRARECRDGRSIQSRRQVDRDRGRKLLPRAALVGEKNSPVGEGDTKVRIWNAASGALVAEFEGAPKILMGAAFSPDGRSLAAVGWDGAVRVWDVASGSMRELGHHGDGVQWVAYSPNGRYLATASTDKTVGVWDAGTGQRVATLPHGAGVMALSYSADGTSLTSADLKGFVRIWDTGTWKLRREMNSYETHQRRRVQPRWSFHRHGRAQGLHLGDGHGEPRPARGHRRRETSMAPRSAPTGASWSWGDPTGAWGCSTAPSACRSKS